MSKNSPILHQPTTTTIPFAFRTAPTNQNQNPSKYCKAPNPNSHPTGDLHRSDEKKIYTNIFARFKPLQSSIKHTTLPEIKINYAPTKKHTSKSPKIQLGTRSILIPNRKKKNYSSKCKNSKKSKAKLTNTAGGRATATEHNEGPCATNDEGRDYRGEDGDDRR